MVDAFICEDRCDGETIFYWFKWTLWLNRLFSFFDFFSRVDGSNSNLNITWLEPINNIIVIEIIYPIFVVLKYIRFHNVIIFSFALLLWWQRKQAAIRYQQIVSNACLCKQNKARAIHKKRYVKYHIIYKSIQSACEQQQNNNSISFDSHSPISFHGVLLSPQRKRIHAAGTNKQPHYPRAHYHSPLVVVFFVGDGAEEVAGRSVADASKGDRKMTQHADKKTNTMVCWALLSSKQVLWKRNENKQHAAFLSFIGTNEEIFFKANAKIRALKWMAQ